MPLATKENIAVGITKLEYVRRCRGESGEQFGVRCGVPQRYISRAEHHREMSNLHLYRVADYLGWVGDPRELLRSMEQLEEVTK